MTTEHRHTLRAAVYLILIKENKILLLRRFNTGWKDRNYSLIAGHLDGNETVTQAMVREAKEEGGITINQEDLSVIHVMHRMSDVEYIDFFLVAKKWVGEPEITEPDKCDDMQWFPLDNLAENILPHVKKAIENYKNNILFSESDWG